MAIHRYHLCFKKPIESQFIPSPSSKKSLVIPNEAKHELAKAWLNEGSPYFQTETFK